MATNNTTATNYLVMGLLLGVGGEGQPAYRTVPCGSFADIEEAFDLAKELAEAQRRQLFDIAAEVGGDIPCYEIRSTEDGYDIVASDRLMERFWILDKNPTEVL